MAPDDHVGQIERLGVEHVPDDARDSRPRNPAFVFIGANLTFGTIIYGWLPFVFVLGFWSNISSLLLGKVLGTLVVAPLAFISPRTGTNLTVSSGAFLRDSAGVRDVGTAPAASPTKPRACRTMGAWSRTSGRPSHALAVDLYAGCWAW